MTSEPSIIADGFEYIKTLPDDAEYDFEDSTERWFFAGHPVLGWGNFSMRQYADELFEAMRKADA